MRTMSIASSFKWTGAGWRIRLAIAATALLAAGSPSPAATWDHVHGDAANSGFASVWTSPAVHPENTVTDIGTYAPGAGPVIGPDGTVFIGNRQGELRALHPDGTRSWQRTLGPPAQEIHAAPVVDIDGSIYVVGTLSYTDGNAMPPAFHGETRLYRFDPGGALLWVRQLPSPLAGAVPGTIDAAVTGAPNIWRAGGNAAIILPAVYRTSYGGVIVLLAFSLPNGNLVASYFISNIGNGVSSGSAEFPGYLRFCLPPPAPSAADTLPRGLLIPHPDVAVHTFPGGAAAWIIAAGLHETIGLNLSPTSGFTELFRKERSGPETLSAPLVLPDAHAVEVTDTLTVDDDCNRVVDAGGLVTFSRPNSAPKGDLTFSPGAGAMPASTADGRLILAHSFGVEILPGSTTSPAAHIDYPAEFMASPAVSLGHFFVSTASSLRTYEVRTLALAGEFDWTGGGQSGPAIGPDGRVYALAANQLLIFPKPPCEVAAFCEPPWTTSGGIVTTFP